VKTNSLPKIKKNCLSL